jgi:hypothetical protein
VKLTKRAGEGELNHGMAFAMDESTFQKNASTKVKPDRVIEGLRQGEVVPVNPLELWIKQ